MALIVGELAAMLDLDANPFSKKLDSTMAQAERSGSERMQRVGGKLTMGLTLPLVAAGGAALKLGTDFDTAFSRMVGLAGVPQAEVDGLKDSVLDLAGETAVAPQQLADALYFAASAGLDTAGAMDAVTYAAKASAAGMGDAEQVVGLVASAVASYGEANIDAARATDILTAAVRAGRADPAELAGTLGRVLPIASQLGISFEEVGGAVAYLSNVFGDTNRTVTALSGLMVKLVSPSQQGRDALEDMGTSVEELQARIDQDGLMGALDLLREKGFAGNQQALRALFDDIEGYQGALALLNDESGSLAETMDEVSDSAGALDDAFAAAERTPGFKMKQALVDVQTAAIQAGDAIAPFVATAASGASTAAEAFAGMSSTGQTAVVGLAAILAGAGPVLSIGGRLAEVWGPNGKLGAGIAALPGKLRGASTGMKLLAGAGGALAAIGIATELHRIATASQQVSVDIGVASRATDDELVEAFLRLREASGDTGLFDAGKELEGFTAIADGSIGTAQRLRDALAAQGEDVTELDEILRSAAAAQAQATSDQEAAIPIVDELTGATDENAEVTNEAADALTAYQGALKAMFDPLFGMVDALNAEAEAQAKLLWLQNSGTASAQELADAERDLAGAVIDTDDAALGLAMAMESGAVSMDQARARLDEWVASGRMTKEQADRIAWSLGIAKGKAEEYSGTYVATLAADVGPAERTLREFMNRSRTIRIQAQIANPHLTVPGVQVRAGGGDVAPGWVLAGEDGPELMKVGASGHVWNAAETRQMLGGDGAPTALRATGGTAASTGPIVVESTLLLDGRKVGSSRSVIEGMDDRRAVRDRNTGGI